MEGCIRLPENKGTLLIDLTRIFKTRGDKKFDRPPRIFQVGTKVRGEKWLYPTETFGDQRRCPLTEIVVYVADYGDRIGHVLEYLAANHDIEELCRNVVQFMDNGNPRTCLRNASKPPHR